MDVQLPLAGLYSSALVRLRCRFPFPLDQHPTGGQQRRRVSFARGGEAACGTPAPARGVVQFGAG